MAKVLVHDRGDRVIRTITVADGQPVVEPEAPRLIEELRTMPVWHKGRRVHPADGTAWLRGLERAFRGVYFRAVYVAE